MIMYQLKPFKRYIYYRNKQLDGMNTDRQIFDNNNNNVLSITSRIGKVCIESKNVQAAYCPLDIERETVGIA